MTPQIHHLPTPDAHRIAWAILGKLNHPPLLYLHGGPGSHANPADAELFNLERHCVIMFDQRGCGLSTPSGDISANTTTHLLADIEQLRIHLGIDRWTVYGGSWGAALALEYAKQQPEQVTALLLRGSFPARQQDLDWFIRPDGIARQHPQAYANCATRWDWRPTMILP
ncbi:MAG: alpha/beta fold hydrolase [Thiolinea sp.]